MSFYGEMIMNIIEAINKVQWELLKDSMNKSIEESLEDANTITFLTILKVKLKKRIKTGG